MTRCVVEPSGIHSNGLTLARRVFFERLRWAPHRHVEDLRRTIGEELLEPTRIYVPEVLAMINANLQVKAFAHITSTGFLNLSRAAAPVGYVLDRLPEPPPIFSLIQQCGGVNDEEMYFTYNMGIGFCVVLAAQDVGAALAIASQHRVRAYTIGFTVSDPEKTVRIPSAKFTGRDGKFSRQ